MEFPGCQGARDDMTERGDMRLWRPSTMRGRYEVERIGLADSIQALRAELSEAMLKAEGDAIQFPVGEVHLQFQVGVTKDAKAKGGARFWIVELGAEAGYAAESIQHISLTLEPPVDAVGERVLVARGFDEAP